MNNELVRWKKKIIRVLEEQAQLAGDGTYPWSENFNGKKLENQKGAKITSHGKISKGVKCSKKGQWDKMCQFFMTNHANCLQGY